VSLTQFFYKSVRILGCSNSFISNWMRCIIHVSYLGSRWD